MVSISWRAGAVVADVAVREAGGVNAGADGGAPESWDRAMGALGAVVLSAALRRTKWIAPWVLARTARSASPGVRRRVTTVAAEGLPEGSGSTCWPAARTMAFCRTVAVTDSGELSER